MLGIEAPKEFTSSASSKDKDHHHLSLLLSSKAPLAILTLLISREVSNNFTLSVSTISIKPNFVKFELNNFNNILTLTNIQGSLDSNQIIFQGKIQNRLDKLLEV